MLNCKPFRTPADTSAKFDSIGPPVSNPTRYKTHVRALQYLTFTRPGIVYVVQQVCLFMHDPRELHFTALKSILQYICGTVDHGLQLYASPSRVQIAYSNVDWVGCPSTHCSMSGYCVFMVHNFFSWTSKRQGTISWSNVEVEYCGVASTVAKTCWLCNLVCELHYPPILFSINAPNTQRLIFTLCETKLIWVNFESYTSHHHLSMLTSSPNGFHRIIT